MMDIQKEREAFEASGIFSESRFDNVYWDEWNNKYVPSVRDKKFCDNASRLNDGFLGWRAAKTQAIPEGFVLIRKRNMVGNPSVDWSQAPRWAKYWLKDGHSNKYWWSSTRPTKDMGLNAFCWKGDYFAEEAPSFGFDGLWDKSLTSKKAMLEAAEDFSQ